ncbi:Cytochrome c oxidase assembly protein COX19 [Penicillium diatomitis]|uniref:Cytochrome c oxidase assembly protein COX19 n=1 Tax=Penicillium diatomitis TaxID=2819901 RepID=A0A9X0BYM3_9EURO|nr:Cytochrome c oxidase assembly protein COX19 [Penicillium diatomitis]KAJ5489372.1 Cytochrome c oxidase assembly protein COX19 [Penicillium diatomitis]
MSFGAPGGGSVNYKPTPPERGSFPLDHEAAEYTRTGECKHIISGYLKCIKLNRGTNDEACRKLAKQYLACRMDKYVVTGLFCSSPAGSYFRSVADENR